MDDLESSPTITAHPPEIPNPPLCVSPAGFIRRTLAFLIDLFIIQCLYLVLLAAGTLGIQLAIGETTSDHSALSIPFVTVWFFLFVCYFTYFHAYGGQTPAKMILRIRVASLEGGTLPFKEALVRTLGYAVSAFFFGLGFFISLLEKKGRGLHDLISHSQVILSE